MQDFKQKELDFLWNACMRYSQSLTEFAGHNSTELGKALLQEAKEASELARKIATYMQE